jgi:hypothetical protein
LSVPFGNLAIRSMAKISADPWFCAPALQRVCHFEETWLSTRKAPTKHSSKMQEARLNLIRFLQSGHSQNIVKGKPFVPTDSNQANPWAIFDGKKGGIVFDFTLA